MESADRQVLKNVGQIFQNMSNALLHQKKAGELTGKQYAYTMSIRYFDGPPIACFSVVANHDNKTIVVCTTGNQEQLVFKMVGQPSYTTLNIVWNDGTTLGNGCINNIPPPAAGVDYTNVDRRFEIFKRYQGAKPSENSASLVASIHQASKRLGSWYINKTIYLDVSDRNLDNLTLTLLVAKMIMVAVLDTTPSEFEGRQNLAAIPSEVQNVLSPITKRVLFRKAARLSRSGLKEFFVLSNLLCKPLYIFEVTHDARSAAMLKISDAITGDSVLFADSIDDRNELCTVTTSNSAIIGSIFKGVINDANNIRISKQWIQNIASPTLFKVEVYPLGDSRYTSRKQIAEIVVDGVRNDRVTMVFLNEPQPVLRVMLLPYLCMRMQSLGFFKLHDVGVPSFSTEEEAFEHIRNLEN